MKKSILVLSLAAFAGGQFVHAAVPVVERTATGTAVDVTPSSTAVAPVATPAPRRAVKPANPAAEMLLMVDQLQEELRFLRGQVEQQGNLIRRMREDQRDRYRDLDRRIGLLTERLAEKETSAPLAPLSEPVSLPLASAVSDATGATPAISDTDAYKNAFALVRQRSFEPALAAFADFLKTYPQSALVPNVLYWSGEVQRAKPTPDLIAAEKAYGQMVSRFPDHGKAADAYYKLGLTYEGLGDKAKAKQMMETVVGRFPDQSSAKLARAYLGRN